jgi:gluconate 2-dehydrogenase gamma chain
MKQPDESRRNFLLSTGGALTSAWLASNWSGIAAAAEHAGHAAAAVTPAGFDLLSASEGADVEAITAQILPGGASPGAREAHAAYFIDRALATFFADRASGFRSGLAQFQLAFRTAHPAAASFAAASAAEQVTFLKSVDRTAFFESMRLLTILGTLSSSQYGGNYEGMGWKLMGFEDQHVFTPPFGYYDRDYAGFVSYRTQTRT